MQHPDSAAGPDPHILQLPEGPHGQRLCLGRAAEPHVPEQPPALAAAAGWHQGHASGIADQGPASCTGEWGRRPQHEPLAQDAGLLPASLGRETGQGLGGAEPLKSQSQPGAGAQVLQQVLTRVLHLWLQVPASTAAKQSSAKLLSIGKCSTGLRPPSRLPGLGGSRAGPGGLQAPVGMELPGSSKGAGAPGTGLPPRPGELALAVPKACWLRQPLPSGL